VWIEPRAERKPKHLTVANLSFFNGRLGLARRTITVMSSPQGLTLFDAGDPETINKAVSVLRARGASAECPRCRTKNWIAELVAFAASPLPHIPGGGVSIGSYVPALSMTCKNCGYVAMHNLVTLGIW